MLHRTLTVTIALALLAGAALAAPAAAQEVFPARPVRLIVSFPPGGGVDAVARLFADKMSPMLGQPVVVENRGGASGTIAGKQVATASPDGYSVLVASNSMLVATVMNPRSGLDIARELQAIASTAPQAVIVVARPDIPAASLKELIALARTRPLNYGSPGVGSVPHLVIEHLFTTIENARMEHIPFPGAAQALTGALGGQIEVAVVTLPPAVAQVAAGKLKGIAVTTPARAAALPEVPTTTEAGYPNVAVTVWNGFFVPAKTPKAIADKLGETILAVAAMPDVKARLGQLGFEPTSIAGEQFQRDVVTELKTWAEIVEKAGIKAQ
ncbi:MAG TPA: tripartite tricarboxylate transporter substrate binding protein [Xanthobacteraceae bacterium]|nr:tripartite tricarboxylate transporter substrate binding protein [Xanthobacteraceae bacterium]